MFFLLLVSVIDCNENNNNYNDNNDNNDDYNDNNNNKNYVDDDNNHDGNDDNDDVNLSLWPVPTLFEELRRSQGVVPRTANATGASRSQFCLPSLAVIVIVVIISILALSHMSTITLVVTLTSFCAITKYYLCQNSFCLFLLIVVCWLI